MPSARPNRKRQALQVGALALLFGVAVTLWTTPWRLEQAIRNASLAELQATARRDPDNEQIHYYCGIRFRQQGHYREAKAEFQRAAKLDGEDEAAWLGWADSAERSGEEREALAVLETFAKAHPQLPRTQLALARCYGRGRQHFRAYQTASMAARLAPKDSEAARCRGEEAIALGRWTDAEQSLTQALPPDARDASAAMTSAWRDAAQQMAAKRYSEAAQSFRSSLKTDPQSASAWQGLGIALNLKGQGDEAFRCLTTALQLDPGLPETLYALAGFSFRTGLTDQAGRLLQSAARLNPDNATYQDALGTVLRLKMDKYGDAEAVFRRAVALEPNNAVYTLDLADIVARSHRSQEAETLYRQLLTQSPGNSEAAFALGRLIVETHPTPDRLDEAEHLLKQVVASDPNHAGALFDLGRLSLIRNAPKQAIDYLERAVVCAPHNAYAFYHLSLAYQRLGNMERARACRAAFQERADLDRNVLDLEQTARVRPKEPAVRLKLARALAKTVETTKAINQYQVYLAMRPNDQSVRRELDAFTRTLTARGQAPDMALFNAMIHLDTPVDAPLK
jgi:tetratricopeptide (TPR) repeat protein